METIRLAGKRVECRLDDTRLSAPSFPK